MENELTPHARTQRLDNRMETLLLKGKTDSILIQFVRYTVVGAAAFMIDFGLLFILTEYLRIYYLTSAAIAFVSGALVNYALCITWVFAKRAIKSRHLEFMIFLTIGIAGLIINELLMWFFTERAHFFYLYSKIFSAVVVYFWNFFVRKFSLFTGK